MTERSGTRDSSDYHDITVLAENTETTIFSGGTIRLEIEYLYISGFESGNFDTEVKIIDFISSMVNNMVPYLIPLIKKHLFFI